MFDGVRVREPEPVALAKFLDTTDLNSITSGHIGFMKSDMKGLESFLDHPNSKGGSSGARFRGPRRRERRGAFSRFGYGEVQVLSGQSGVRRNHEAPPFIGVFCQDQHGRRRRGRPERRDVEPQELSRYHLGLFRGHRKLLRLRITALRSASSATVVSILAKQSGERRGLMVSTKTRLSRQNLNFPFSRILRSSPALSPSRAAESSSGTIFPFQFGWSMKLHQGPSCRFFAKLIRPEVMELGSVASRNLARATGSGSTHPHPIEHLHGLDEVELVGADTL